MPAKRIWTEQERATIAGLLLSRVTSDDLATRFGVSPGHMRKAISSMGLRYQAVPRASIPPRPSIPESRCQNWWPLPAGSDATWRAISDQPWPGHER